MSVAAGANSDFVHCLRGRVPRKPHAPDGRRRGANRTRHLGPRTGTAGSARTIDLLHQGYGTTGVGRLGEKPRRRTRWSSAHEDTPACATAAIMGTAPLSARTMTARTPKRPASAPSIGASSAVTTPLAQRRRRAVENLKLESQAKPRDLPTSRATWIVEHENTSRQNASVSFNDAVATPPLGPPPDRSKALSPRHASVPKLESSDAQEPDTNMPLRQRALMARAELERLHAARIQAPDSERVEFDQAIAKAENTLTKQFDELTRVLGNTLLVDTNGDGIIDAFEMQAAMCGKGGPTRPVGGRTAELATPKHHRQCQREARGIYHVGDGEQMQQHEEVGCGWVRVLERSGETYYWHARLRRSQWEPPLHAVDFVQLWRQERGALSAATLRSLARRHQHIQSGKAAEDMRKREVARRRVEAARLRQAQLVEDKARSQHQSRLHVLKQQFQMTGWISKLGAEAHLRFLEHVTVVQAKWRGILARRFVRRLRKTDREVREKQLWQELVSAMMLQKHIRGFLERKRIRYLLDTPFAVYIMIGVPGSGKSTLARRLAEDFAMIRVCPEEIILAEVGKTGAARAASSASEADRALMKQFARGGDLLPLERLMPYIKLHVNRARLRTPYAACLLDGFPINTGQLETMERGDPPFHFCTYAHAFVCEAPEAVALGRAVHNGKKFGLTDDSVHHFLKTQQDAMPQLLGDMQEPEQLTALPIEMAVRHWLRKQSVQYLKKRACGHIAHLDKTAVFQVEQNIRTQTWRGGRIQIDQALKDAIIELIIEGERDFAAHWLLPKGKRIIKVDTGPAYKPSKAYAMLLQNFCETQYIVQQHICRLALRLDTNNSVLKGMLALAELEEKSRLVSIEVAALLIRGAEAYGRQSFAEAVAHHQKAHDVAVAAQHDEHERVRWEAQVQKLTAEERLTYASLSESVSSKGPRWRPEFPSALMVDQPEQLFTSEDWSVPVNPNEIKRALAYSAQAL